MDKRNYDLVFGIGQACGCSHSLRCAGLQHLSFPGDWTTLVRVDATHPAFGHDLRVRVDNLCNGCEDFFNPDFFTCKGRVSNTGKAVYYNTKTCYLFNHDFPVDGDLRKALPIVRAKYRRRRDRLFELIRQAKRVLVVRIDVPGGSQPTPLDDCRYARKRLHERFASATFDFLLVSYAQSVPCSRRTFLETEPGLFQIAFDFLDTKSCLPLQPNKKLLGAVLAELFAVRDYRTPEEKRRFAAQRRKARIARLKENLSRPFVRLIDRLVYGTFGRQLRSQRRTHAFDQIAILGFNCEPAFRFYCCWGFLDSSLFAWANCIGLECLSRALEDLSSLGTGSFTYHAPSRMWRCDRSQVFFHGRLKPAHGTEPSGDELSADREELRARLAHLKEKLVGYARNEKSTLFVYKLNETDAQSPDLGRLLDGLESALVRLGARNWKLLVVCERKNLNRMPQGGNRVFRAVEAYNPTAKVTDRRLGDPIGWNRIFTEFAPAAIRPKAHAFKFEAD